MGYYGCAVVVLVITACPPGLRGYLTRWLMEISPGVFVTGRISARVRDKLWERTVALCQDGRAILVYKTRNEQRLDFRVHRHDWDVVDSDGLKLVRRPSASPDEKNPMRPGWSFAAKRRRYRH